MLSPGTSSPCPPDRPGPGLPANPLSAEHRARELLNLAQMSYRCATLPGLSFPQRQRWHREARRALDALQCLLPAVAAQGGTAAEVITLAARLAVEIGVDEP